jgi:hypothetical protein
VFVVLLVGLSEGLGSENRLFCYYAPAGMVWLCWMVGGLAPLLASSLLQEYVWEVLM